MCENMSTAGIERSKLSSECTVRRYRIRMMHMRLEHECARRMRLKGIGCPYWTRQIALSNGRGCCKVSCLHGVCFAFCTKVAFQSNAKYSAFFVFCNKSCFSKRCTFHCISCNSGVPEGEPRSGIIATYGGP